MNGITPSAEDEIRKLEASVKEALLGLNVSVVMGSTFKDSIERPLDPTGVQAVVDRLRARGFKIVRA
jgi:hypothetical protein